MIMNRRFYLINLFQMIYFLIPLSVHRLGFLSNEVYYSVYRVLLSL